MRSRSAISRLAVITALLSTPAAAESVPFSCVILPGAEVASVMMTNSLNSSASCMVTCRFSTTKYDNNPQITCVKPVPAGKEVTEEWQRRLETAGENDSPARELARTIRDAAQRYVPEMTVKVVYRRDRYLRGGDHIPFLAQGYTAVRFTEAHEDFRQPFLPEDVFDNERHEQRQTSASHQEAWLE